MSDLDAPREAAPLRQGTPTHGSVDFVPSWAPAVVVRGWRGS